jgi:DNA-binding FrmR family transcriptional regulator
MSSRHIEYEPLATIEGHLKGSRKMVEEDQYCVDIIHQSYAVERALKAFEAALSKAISACASRLASRKVAIRR